MSNICDVESVVVCVRERGDVVVCRSVTREEVCWDRCPDVLNDDNSMPKLDVIIGCVAVEDEGLFVEEGKKVLDNCSCSVRKIVDVC